MDKFQIALIIYIKLKDGLIANLISYRLPEMKMTFNQSLIIVQLEHYGEEVMA